MKVFRISIYPGLALESKGHVPGPPGLCDRDNLRIDVKGLMCFWIVSVSASRAR
jgi:hypothetical protein